MKDISSALKEIGAKNGLEIALDENGACTLELSDGRVMLLQERAELNELDFVATLGPVPEEARAAVFTELLAANFYWNETFGATISWNATLEEAVIMYPRSWQFPTSPWPFPTKGIPTPPTWAPSLTTSSTSSTFPTRTRRSSSTRISARP